MSSVGNRYDQMFARLKDKQEGAFVPFVTIGDPGKEQSIAVIKALIDAGADALELGIPFSDPSADGVTIQMAGIRALAAGITTDICIDILKEIREYAPQVPIGLLLYGNLVFARGISDFYQDMSDAGVDSILIADVPIRESAPFRKAAIDNGIAPIFIAPPNADPETLKEVAAFSHGYTYVLSRAGVTGTETKAAMPADDLINTLSKFNAPPPVLGFGISAPEQVADAIKSGASGAISGSATVKIIEQNLNDHDKMLAELKRFVSAMKAATKAN
ncbi:tryptophan synthase subunit alpha [Thalassotalea euphylliae]|uniref:tryptophan synthase subunit alpha n=1 Tax=Thalassotalea euphylliae TaxID=1655234 RepID=UPI0036346B50